MKIFISVIFFLFFNTSFAVDYEFFGVIKFSKTNIISYRLVFSENNGKISGYSITDLQGLNETKNIIVGTYNKKTNALIFKEKQMEYTKSKVTKNDFCNIYFEGKVNLLSSDKLKGNFQSFFSDNSPCINGDLSMVSSKKATSRMEKFDKKISKSKRIDEEVKDSISLVKVLNELKVNIIKEGEVVSVFMNSSEIFISFYDAGQEDGDEITVFYDDLKIISNYSVLNKEKILKLTLKNNNSIIKIISNSEGRIPPNTTKVKIYNKEKTIELFTDLKKNEATSIQIIKN
ncbi:hypothetical protein [Flavobacterium sp.]|jgi:hypothetical protein|uniref:hypothetical protein n=1 Tax=Flavobacterium sp. TaxID=239 RepID=UPI002A8097A7|nr:hypothetical protein [Flavobacterium sp.]